MFRAVADLACSSIVDVAYTPMQFVGTFRLARTIFLNRSEDFGREVRYLGTVLNQACDFQSSVRGRPGNVIYTERLACRSVSERPHPREVTDVERRNHAPQRLVQTRLACRQSQPLHHIAIGSSRFRAATARRPAPLDQAVRAG